MIRKNDVKAQVRAAMLLKAISETGEKLVPVTVSARHIHLCEEHVHILFGKGYRLCQKAELFQPGQYAAEETVAIEGPKGSFKSVRVLGPARGASQVEISVTDAYTLGIPPVIRLSGDIAGTPGIRVIGPAGQVELSEGVIAAQRHIHFSTRQAAVYGVTQGSRVALTSEGVRPAELRGFIARVDDAYELEAHVDTDEANACMITNDMLLCARVE